MSILNRLNPLRIVPNTLDAIEAVVETVKAVGHAGDRILGDGQDVGDSLRQLSRDAKRVADKWEEDA